MDAAEFDIFVREARRTSAELAIVKQGLQDLQERYNGLITVVEELQYEVSELTGSRNFEIESA